MAQGYAHLTNVCKPPALPVRIEEVLQFPATYVVFVPEPEPVPVPEKSGKSTGSESAGNVPGTGTHAGTGTFGWAPFRGLPENRWLCRWSSLPEVLVDLILRPESRVEFGILHPRSGQVIEIVIGGAVSLSKACCAPNVVLRGRLRGVTLNL